MLIHMIFKSQIDSRGESITKGQTPPDGNRLSMRYSGIFVTLPLECMHR